MLIGVPYILMSILFYRYCHSNVELLERVIATAAATGRAEQQKSGDQTLQQCADMFKA